MAGPNSDPSWSAEWRAEQAASASLGDALPVFRAEQAVRSFESAVENLTLAAQRRNATEVAMRKALAPLQPALRQKLTDHLNINNGYGFRDITASSPDGGVE